MPGDLGGSWTSGNGGGLGRRGEVAGDEVPIATAAIASIGVALVGAVEKEWDRMEWPGRECGECSCGLYEYDR